MTSPSRSQALLQELYPLHVEYLQTLLKSGKIHHAYGISSIAEGPQLAYATLFAEQLLGSDYPLHQHPDFLRVTNPEDRKTIGVDEAHAVRQHLMRRPLLAKFRVVLIEQMDLFTNAAANAVLKILEEPPAFAVILATTSAMESLPATVRSRMQFVQMPQISETHVTRLLQEASIADAEKASVRACIGGKFERMVSILEQTPEATQMLEERAYWHRFLHANTAERNTMVQTYIGTGEHAQAASHTIAHVLDVMESILHQSFVASPTQPEDTYRLQLERIQELRTMISHNVQKKMVFDYLTFAL